MTDPTLADSQPRAQVFSLQDELLADLISSGDHYMSEACVVAGLHYRTVYRRLAKDAEFAELMNEAQQAGLEVRRARLDRVAAGEEGFSSGDWRRDGLILKQGNWTLEKLHPTLYGPKAELAVKSVGLTGEISNDPVEAARQYEQVMRPR